MNISKYQKGFLNIIAALIVGAVAVIAGAFIDHKIQPASISAPAQKVGAVNYVTGGGTYRLASSISSSQTTIKLSSFKEPVSGTPYTMSYLNSALEYMTLDPQTNNSEFISFTGITQNADGTATLTGVTRGLGRSYPYTSSATFMLTHSGQSVAILSNSPQIYNDIYSYINTSLSAGAVYASPNIVGLVQVATSGLAAVNAQPTTVGATTTYYALTSNIASSTRKANTAQVIVSSSTDGYIDPSFINTATLFTSPTLTGTTNITGTTSLASTTFVNGFPLEQIIAQTVATSASPVKLSFATSSKLRIIMTYTVSQGAGDTALCFNTDIASSTNNYGIFSFGNAGGTLSASSSAANNINLKGTPFAAPATNYYVFNINNATTSAPKLVSYQGESIAGTGVSAITGAATWYGTTTNQITSITLTSASGNLSTTSITVYGTPNY